LFACQSLVPAVATNNELLTTNYFPQRMTDDLKKIPLVLHVGYHKTATTFLQKLVFPKQQQVLYAGRPFRTKAIGDFFLYNQFTNPLLFDPAVARERFYNAIGDWVTSSNQSLSEKKALLVSHESLHSGPDWFGSEVMMMSQRLKNTFPDARIVIGIRNQVSYIESNYKEYLLHGGKLRFKRFMEETFAFRYGLLPKLHYDKVIGQYMDLFGKDRVHIYLIEELKEDLAATVNKMMQFMGAESSSDFRSENVNMGLSRMSSGLLRVVNTVMASDLMSSTTTGCTNAFREGKNFEEGCPGS